MIRIIHISTTHACLVSYKTIRIIAETTKYTDKDNKFKWLIFLSLLVLLYTHSTIIISINMYFL